MPLKTTTQGLIQVLYWLTDTNILSEKQTLSVGTVNYKPWLKIGNIGIKTNAGKFEIYEWNRDSKEYVHKFTAWLNSANTLEAQSELGI